MNLLLATFESYMIYAAAMALGVALIGLVLKRVKQPYLIGYIIVGALVGNQGLGLVTNTELIHHFGEIGIVLLLFFIGSEINLTEFISKWKLAALGTSIQVGVSVALALSLSYLSVFVVGCRETEIFSRFPGMKVRTNIFFIVGSNLLNDIHIHVDFKDIIHIELFVVTLN